MPSIFPSLFFTVDIAHAHDLSAALRRNGVKVYPISGDTPDDEENRFIRLFKGGAIDGLASCGVLQEGFDAPNAMGAFLCRGTKSGLLYRQMCGRVFRPFPAPVGDRYYQRDALKAMEDELAAGVTAQLVVLPTGTGKTYVAAHTPEVIKSWKMGQIRGRTLFLVHRDTLVTQAADTFREWTSLSVGIEKGGGHRAGDAEVVVASVQSIGPGTCEDLGDGAVKWTYNKRLKSFRPQDFDTVIVDESHHAVKGVYYLNVLRHMRCLKGEEDRDPNVLLLCITATPGRADNIGMEKICDKIVYDYTLRQAVKDKFLAKPHGYRIETEVDISHVHTTAGDLNTAELSLAINTPERNELVAKEYLRIRELVAKDIPPGEWTKPYAAVVDFVDVSGRHTLQTLSSLFGLRDKFDPKGGDVAEQSDEAVRMDAENPGLGLLEENSLEAMQARLARMKTTMHKLDLLAVAEMPEELKRLTKYSWGKEAAGSYNLSLLDGQRLSIREDSLGHFDIFRHMFGVRTKLATGLDLPAAIKQAETLIPNEDRGVLAADAGWRLEPPSEKQVRLLYTLDSKMRDEFGRPEKLWQFVLAQHHAGKDGFSRGGISRKIDSLRAARA